MQDKNGISKMLPESSIQIEIKEPQQMAECLGYPEENWKNPCHPDLVGKLADDVQGDPQWGPQHYPDQLQNPYYLVGEPAEQLQLGHEQPLGLELHMVVNVERQEKGEEGS